MKHSRSRLSLAATGTVMLLGGLVTFGVLPAHAGSHAAAGTKLVKTQAAHILVTPKGKTLYTFAADTQNKSTCYGECAKFWPPRLVASGTTPPAKMAGVPGTFGVTMRTDGTHQLTYNGAPLYTFAGDKKPGDINGEGLLASGGYWWAVVTRGK